MKAIGGYFGLELGDGGEYHPDAIRLNTARNAFEYILVSRGYSKVYMPYFTCDVLWQPLEKLGIPFEYYSIDKDLEPVFDFSNISEGEAFLYTNYFGIKDRFIEDLAARVSNLIVDNAQGFYARPCDDTDTFYSPRKFFGLSDGAYVYTQSYSADIQQDISYQRIGHLVMRLDRSAEEGYPLFVENDKSLDNLPVMRMSNFTEKVLRSVNYTQIAEKRVKNFKRLHKALAGHNGLNIAWSEGLVPMVYPFLTDDTELRKKLISKRIYTALYWPNVLETADYGSVEHQYATKLIHLPVDQRYDESDLDYVIEQVIR